MIDTIGMTDIGNGRPSNQDAYLLRQQEKNGKLYLLAVVCDGMGGLKKGEIASRYIVEVLKQWFDETLFDRTKSDRFDPKDQSEPFVDEQKNGRSQINGKYVNIIICGRSRIFCIKCWRFQNILV